jgi:hypothetical protein
MLQTRTLELQMQFLHEKRTEPYIWYGEGSIRVENCICSQEDSGSQAPLGSRLAGVRAGR